MTLKIRAHHFLCLQGYQGYGYSDEYKLNLERILKLIQTMPDVEVEVIAQNDMICDYCPNKNQIGCKKDSGSIKTIRSLDLKVLEKLNIMEGVIDKASNLMRKVNTQFKNFPDIQAICDHCQWTEKCRWFQKVRYRWETAVKR